MKKSPKQNWESNIRRTPIILGLSAALCMPSAFSYANASDPVAGELVQSVQQGRTVTGLSLIHISEPTRRTPISYAVFCLKKKKKEQPRFYYTYSLLKV